MAAKPPPRPEDNRITEIPNLIRDPTSCRYLPTSIIGTGGFASVWRAKVAPSRSTSSYTSSDVRPSSNKTPSTTTTTHPEPTECALKVVRRNIKSSQLRTRFQFELAIHNKLRHPHIVAFHRAFTFSDLTYISLSLCENGSLTDVVKRRKFLTMPEIRRYMIQLAGAVEHLHSRDVVHRDIKAGNVFLDANMDVKLGDFGLAACLEPSATDANLFHRRTTFCGTPNYLAPELLSRKGHARGVDIWALGILVYYLAVGAAPFHSKKKEEIYKRVANKDYDWPAPGPNANEIPADLKELVGSILVEEEVRPTPAMIVQHPFFRDGFVPERIDSLARTRRPRWARSGGGATNANAAGSLNITSESTSSANSTHISSFDNTLSTHTSTAHPPTRNATKPSTYDTLLATSFTLSLPRHESVLLSVQRELEAGIGLRIPLAEGVCYDAFAPLPAMAPTVKTLPKRKRDKGGERVRGRKVEVGVRMDEDAGIGCSGEFDGGERAEDALRRARVRRLDVAADDEKATMENQMLPPISLWPTTNASTKVATTQSQLQHGLPSTVSKSNQQQQHPQPPNVTQSQGQLPPEAVPAARSSSHPSHSTKSTAAATSSSQPSQQPHKPQTLHPSQPPRPPQSSQPQSWQNQKSSKSKPPSILPYTTTSTSNPPNPVHPRSPMPLSPSTSSHNRRAANTNPNANLVRKAVALIDAKIAPPPTSTSTSNAPYHQQVLPSDRTNETNSENDENTPPSSRASDPVPNPSSRNDRVANAASLARMAEKPVRSKTARSQVGGSLRERPTAGSGSVREASRTTRGDLGGVGAGAVATAREPMVRRLRSARRLQAGFEGLG